MLPVPMIAMFISNVLLRGLINPAFLSALSDDPHMHLVSCAEYGDYVVYLSP